jgi:hypothetical protein
MVQSCYALFDKGICSAGLQREVSVEMGCFRPKTAPRINISEHGDNQLFTFSCVSGETLSDRAIRYAGLQQEGMGCFMPKTAPRINILGHRGSNRLFTFSCVSGETLSHRGIRYASLQQDISH